MPGLTDIPQEQMEEAMQRACDEQAKIMADVGDKNVTKNGQDKKIGKFSAKEVADMIVRDYGDVLKRLSKT